MTIFSPTYIVVHRSNERSNARSFKFGSDRKRALQAYHALANSKIAYFGRLYVMKGQVIDYIAMEYQR